MLMTKLLNQRGYQGCRLLIVLAASLGSTALIGNAQSGMISKPQQPLATQTKSKNSADSAVSKQVRQDRAPLAPQQRDAEGKSGALFTVASSDNCMIYGFDATKPTDKLKTGCTERQLKKWFDARYKADKLPAVCWPQDEAKNKIVVNGKRYLCNSVWTEVEAGLSDGR